MQLRLMFAVGADLVPPSPLGAEPPPLREIPVGVDGSDPRSSAPAPREPELLPAPRELRPRQQASEQGLRRRDQHALLRRPAPSGPFVADALRIGRFSFGDGLDGGLPVLLDVTV